MIGPLSYPNPNLEDEPEEEYTALEIQRIEEAQTFHEELNDRSFHDPDK